ncbi:glutathione S-transferase theta-1-like [Watersipora subatra]|uniref:glutathione S-transferase theta-1-like n=1 Tax=Watersipora subatra TaxID=2589382 RepID=UPI00355C7AE5
MYYPCDANPIRTWFAAPAFPVKKKTNMLKAYVDLVSQPSRAVFMFLKISKIPHSIVPVALMKGEHVQEDYAKSINPFKLVPVIHDGSLVIPESVAILQYLCKKHGINSLYPEDLEAQARIDIFTQWQHTNLRRGGTDLFQSLLVQPMSTGKPVDESRAELGSKILHASLKSMENIFLKDSPFINNDSMSIADLLGVSEVMQPQLGLGMDFSSYPKLSDWSRRVRNEVGADIFDEAHFTLSMMGKHFQEQKHEAAS